MTPWILLGTLAFAGVSPSSRRDAAIARMNEGVAYHGKQRLDAAESAMAAAIELDSDLIEARLSLARILVQRHRYAAARRVLIAAFARPTITPAMRVEVLYAIGRVHDELGRDGSLPTEERRSELRDAASVFADVIAADPRHFRAHYGRAAALEELDRPTQADEAFRACLAIEPRYTPCWIGLGHMNIDYGFHNLGLAVLEKGVEVNPDDAELWNGLGRAHMALGDSARAVVAFEKASALDPTLVEVLFGLGRAYADLGRNAEAIDRLGAFLEHAGDDVPEHYKRAAQDMLSRLHDPR